MTATAVVKSTPARFIFLDGIDLLSRPQKIIELAAQWIFQIGQELCCFLLLLGASANRWRMNAIPFSFGHGKTSNHDPLAGAKK